MNLLESISLQSMILTLFFGIILVVGVAIYLFKKRMQKTDNPNPRSDGFEHRNRPLLREVPPEEGKSEEHPMRYPWEGEPPSENKTFEQVLIGKIDSGEYDVELEEADGRSKGAITILGGATVKVKSIKRRKEGAEEEESSEPDEELDV